MSALTRLLLATDFLPQARQAEHVACTLAASWHVHFTVMTALEFQPGLNPDYSVNQQYLTVRTREATEQLATFKFEAMHRGLDLSNHVGTGLPSEGIKAKAQVEEADLIILGTTGLAHVFLGSTAERGLDRNHQKAVRSRCNADLCWADVRLCHVRRATG